MLPSQLLRRYGKRIGPASVGSEPGYAEATLFIDILIQAEKLRVEQKSKSLMYIDPPVWRYAFCFLTEKRTC